MRIMHLTAGFFLVAILATVQASLNQALGDGCWPVGYYSTYSTESVPYFAQHPPVYYGNRVPRSYGYSPYAYPPGVLTPGSEPTRPVVQNFYQSVERGEEEGQGPVPVRIDNPFVQPSEKAPTAKAAQPWRRAKVIYPASLAQRSK